MLSSRHRSLLRSPLALAAVVTVLSSKAPEAKADESCTIDWSYGQCGGWECWDGSSAVTMYAFTCGGSGGGTGGGGTGDSTGTGGGSSGGTGGGTSGGGSSSSGACAQPGACELIDGRLVTTIPSNDPDAARAQLKDCENRASALNDICRSTLQLYEKKFGSLPSEPYIFELGNNRQIVCQPPPIINGTPQGLPSYSSNVPQAQTCESSSAVQKEADRDAELVCQLGCDRSYSDLSADLVTGKMVGSDSHTGEGNCLCSRSSSGVILGTVRATTVLFSTINLGVVEIKATLDSKATEEFCAGNPFCRKPYVNPASSTMDFDDYPGESCVFTPDARASGRVCYVNLTRTSGTVSVPGTDAVTSCCPDELCLVEPSYRFNEPIDQSGVEIGYCTPLNSAMEKIAEWTEEANRLRECEEKGMTEAQRNVFVSDLRNKALEAVRGCSKEFKMAYFSADTHPDLKAYNPESRSETLLEAVRELKNQQSSGSSLPDIAAHFNMAHKTCINSRDLLELQNIGDAALKDLKKDLYSQAQTLYPIKAGATAHETRNAVAQRACMAACATDALLDYDHSMNSLSRSSFPGAIVGVGSTECWGFSATSSQIAGALTVPTAFPFIQTLRSKTENARHAVLAVDDPAARGGFLVIEPQRGQDFAAGGTCEIAVLPPSTRTGSGRTAQRFMADHNSASARRGSKRTSTSLKQKRKKKREAVNRLRKVVSRSGSMYR